MSTSEHTTETHHQDHAAMSTKTIWNVFWVLLILTVAEFIIALAIPLDVMPKPYKNILYIVLTIAKAYYIVAYFMHLKFEKLGLIYSIVLPSLFIILFIIAMIYEGNFWLLER